MKYGWVTLCSLAAAGAMFVFMAGCENNNGDGGSTTTTTIPSAALVAPTQTAPANGAIVTGAARNATLTWTAVPGASSYHVEAEANTGSWVNFVDTGTAGTSLTVHFGGDNECRWRVWALDSASNPGPMSGWSTFTFDSTP